MRMSPAGALCGTLALVMIGCSTGLVSETVISSAETPRTSPPTTDAPMIVAGLACGWRAISSWGLVFVMHHNAARGLPFRDLRRVWRLAHSAAVVAVMRDRHIDAGRRLDLADDHRCCDAGREERQQRESHADHDQPVLLRPRCCDRPVRH